MKNKEELLKEYILNRKDKKAVELLYKKVLPQIKRYCLQNGGTTEDALDVFQEGLMTFYRHFFTEQRELKNNMFGYMYQISINLYRTHMKRKPNTTSIDENEWKDSLIAPNTATKNDHTLAKQLLEKLGAKCQDILHLSVFSELPQEDIMVRLGFSSIGAVKMQYKRCKQKLMELAEQHPALINELKEIA